MVAATCIKLIFVFSLLKTTFSILNYKRIKAI